MDTRIYISHTTGKKYRFVSVLDKTFVIIEDIDTGARLTIKRTTLYNNFEEVKT